MFKTCKPIKYVNFGMTRRKKKLYFLKRTPRYEYSTLIFVLVRLKLFLFSKIRR